ncbi:MAG: LysE family translocator [Pseudomonadota bacterium]
MLEFATLATFVAASAVLALAPGPDNLFVMASSIQSGVKAGLFVTLGLCSGLIVHTLAVAFGLAAVFAASPEAFTVLKLVGAGYILYLAVQAWRSEAETGAGNGEKSGEKTNVKHPSGWAMVRRGFVMNVTNPKVAIFFLAFLPQFADAQAGSVPLQLVTLGAVFMLVTLMVFSAIAGVSGLAGAAVLQSQKRQITINRLASAVFAFLALNLLLTAR